MNNFLKNFLVNFAIALLACSSSRTLLRNAGLTYAAALFAPLRNFSDPLLDLFLKYLSSNFDYPVKESVVDFLMGIYI